MLTKDGVRLNDAAIATSADVVCQGANACSVPALTTRLAALNPTAANAHIFVDASPDVPDSLAEGAISSARLAGFAEVSISVGAETFDGAFQLPEPTFFLEPSADVTLPEKKALPARFAIIHLLPTPSRVQLIANTYAEVPSSFETAADVAAAFRKACDGRASPCVDSVQIDFGGATHLVDAVRVANRLGFAHAVPIRFARRTSFPSEKGACK